MKQRDAIRRRLQEALDKKGWPVSKLVAELKARLGDDFSKQTVYGWFRTANPHIPAVDTFPVVAELLEEEVSYLRDGVRVRSEPLPDQQLAIVLDVVRAVQEVSLARKIRLSPDEERALVRLIYRHCAVTRQVDPDYVAEVVSLKA